MFFKIGVLKNFTIFTRKYLCWNLCYTIAVLQPCNYIKSYYSSTGVFLWTLPNFKEHPFWRTSANGCFWNLKLLSAIFHYFYKTNVFLCYFEQSTLKRNLTYSCFFFPLFHEHLFCPGLPCATHLLETSCLEKITVCVMETMLLTFLLVQMNKARREVNRTNQVQTKINIVKGLQTSVIHLIPGSTCHWISNRMRYFFKNIFWSKYFPATTNRRNQHLWEFLVKPFLKIS